MLRLSQLQALKILETINLRLVGCKNSMREILIAVDDNKIQFNKARRQGLELIKEFDRYANLAYRIIEKHLNGVTNCKPIEILDSIVSCYNEYSHFFQN